MTSRPPTGSQPGPHCSTSTAASPRGPLSPRSRFHVLAIRCAFRATTEEPWLRRLIRGRHDRQVRIATRERWENEDHYRANVFAVKGGGGPPIGLGHPDAGTELPSFSFGTAERFDIDD